MAYTRVMASRDALLTIKTGIKFHGREYCEKCQKFLDVNNAPYHPMDGTWMRYLRLYAEEFGVELLDRNKSLYIKRDKDQLELF